MQKTTRASGISPALLLLALTLGSCGRSDGGPQESGPVFRFSAIPDEKPTDQEARFQPVADYLAETLGVAVEYVPVNQYSASVQAFKNDDVQAAWFGGLSGVQARLAVEGATAIAQGDADPHYYSYFIANVDTGLEPGSDFPLDALGMKFTFGSEGSTSGRLMPEAFIREATGRSPKEFFSAVGFAGNHPATLAAVQSGAFDIGALNYKVYDAAKPDEKDHTRIIWRTPSYADYNFTVHGDLDETFGAGFTERLTRAWIAMPSGLCERSFSRDHMIPARNEDFAQLEETAKALDLARSPGP